jgi:AAA domain
VLRPDADRAADVHQLIGGPAVVDDGPGFPTWPQPPAYEPAEVDGESASLPADVVAHYAKPRNNGQPQPRPVPEPPLTLYTEEELAALPAPTWQVDRILPAGGTTLLVGRKGTYKTFLALDLAASIATGAEWHGHATTPAKVVVYIAGEGRSGIGARLAAIREARGIATTRILVYPAPLALLTMASADRLADGILAKLEQFAPDLAGALPVVTVWDTLHRCIKGADESASATVGLAYGTLDRMRERLDLVTALLLHHPSKLSDDGRGSTAWEDDADAVWTTERETGSRLVTLKNTKQKDAEEHEPITLELITAGDSLVVTSHGADWKLTDHRTLSPGERKALDTLSAFHPEAIGWTRWRDASGLGDASLSRHRKRLRSLGYLEVEQVGRHSRYRLTGEGMAALT